MCLLKKVFVDIFSIYFITFSQTCVCVVSVPALGLAVLGAAVAPSSATVSPRKEVLCKLFVFFGEVFPLENGVTLFPIRSRIPYIFIMFIFSIFAVIMSLYGEKELWSNDLLNTSFKVCNSSTCEGNGSVYRVSFALFLFFLIHVVMVWMVLAFHWSFFFVKFLCLVAWLIASFFMDGDFFNG